VPVEEVGDRVPERGEQGVGKPPPEVSAVCAATLVAELGTPKDYEHYRQVLSSPG
jgi:hypothetical protein